MVTKKDTKTRVSPTAELADSVVVMDGVVIGQRTVIRNNVVIYPGTRIGDDVTVYDNADLRQVFPFTRSECKLKIKGEVLLKVVCKRTDRASKVLLRKLPGVPDLFRFVLRARRLALQPFQSEDVTVRLTTGTIDRPDEIGDLMPCVIAPNGGKRIKCREPTGF